MNSSHRATVILLVLIGGCATASNHEQERAALLRVDEAWASAASEGKNVERIVSFWSDDATVYPAGAPVVRGKAAIRNFVQESLAVPGFHISWHSDTAVLSNDGTMAYTTGENAITIPGPDGQLSTITGRGVAVWRRSLGGEWKCVVDIWNSAQ